MNKTSTDKIKSAALFLIWFRRYLPPSIQAIVRPYLDQPYQLALNVLDGCSSTEPVVMTEVAQLAGVTRETVRQVLLALKEGGMTLTACPNQGWQSAPSENFSSEMLSDVTVPSLESAAAQYPQGGTAPAASRILDQRL